MKIERMTEIETPDIQIGDRLRVGRYTATCQKVTEKGATFLLDQYLDRPMPMNKKNTNHGGYDNSDLRKYLQSDTVLSDFEEIRPYMQRRLAPDPVRRRDVRRRDAAMDRV